jgi:hypothetical protein
LKYFRAVGAHFLNQNKEGGLECTSRVLGSEFGSKIYNNYLHILCNHYHMTHDYGRLVHNSEPKTEIELGLSFGTEFYNNLFENFEIFLNFTNVI